MTDVMQHHRVSSYFSDETYLTETSRGSIQNVNSCRIPNRSRVKPS